MSELEIIGMPQSSYVRTTRIALEEKGVPCTLTIARPHSAEVDSIHPYGKIPVMRHGDFVLFESRAIIAYADRAFDGPSLMPADAKFSARVEQWISAINTGLFPAVFPYLRENAFPTAGTRNETLIAERVPFVQEQIGILDRAVGACGCLAGADFSLADMYAIPILHYLRLCPESGQMIGASEYLPRYFDRHSRRTSVEKTVPPPFSELPPRPSTMP